MKLEEELLLAHIIGKDRAWLFTHSKEITLSLIQKIKFWRLKRKLAYGVPLPYLINHKEFFGIKFFVNKHTLIPREETEILVELAISIGKSYKHPLIIDVGTGSGCIAIACAKNLPNANIIALDNSRKTLRVAKKNSKLLSTNIFFINSNLLKKIPNILPKFDHLIITANLPYIPTGEYCSLAKQLHFEPKNALEAGMNGLRYYQELFKQLSNLIKKLKAKITVLIEIMPEQKIEIEQLQKKILPASKLIFHKDLAQKIRVSELKLN